MVAGEMLGELGFDRVLLTPNSPLIECLRAINDTVWSAFGADWRPFVF